MIGNKKVGRERRIKREKERKRERESEGGGWEGVGLVGESERGREGGLVGGCDSKSAKFTFDEVVLKRDVYFFCVLSRGRCLRY